MKLLVADRGEIAVRVLRAGAQVGVGTVALYSQDDADSLHSTRGDEAIALEGVGAAAYEDVGQIVAAALDSGCDAIHPGSGRLAETADLARRCAEAGLIYVGPKPETVELLADKTSARTAAKAAGVPTLRGIDHGVSVQEAVDFLDGLGDDGAMMIKAAAGSGGRAMMAVTGPGEAGEVAAAWRRVSREALAIFGSGDVYVEEFLPRARHVEVQLLGDRDGVVVSLGDRDGSVQRRFLRLVDIAPAAALEDDLRARVVEAAIRLAESVGYVNAGTFEFLVDVSRSGVSRSDDVAPFAFLEADPCLSPAHTVTEEVLGIDLVGAQIRLAAGATLEELGLGDGQRPTPDGFAIQARVSTESVREDGSFHPTHGTLTAYEAPSGPGVRTDGLGTRGYRTSLLYDFLLAKVIGRSRSPELGDAVARTVRALDEFRIDGVETNVAFLRNVLEHQDFATARIHTRFVDEQMAQLVTGCEAARDRASVRDSGSPVRASSEAPATEDAQAVCEADCQRAPQAHAAFGLVSPIQGTIVEIGVVDGSEVRRGQPVAVVEAMKLQHDIVADRSGVVCEVAMSVGDVVREGYPIVFLTEAAVEDDGPASAGAADLDLVRDDMRELEDRIAQTLDPSHPDAVAARHAAGRRTARENIEDLVDPGSFREFGPAASGSVEGGTVIGFGTANADLFGGESSRVAVIHNHLDTTTTTNGAGHYREEPVHELVRDFQVPLVLFSEGEGRPYVGPHGFQPGVGIDSQLFSEFAKLSGLVPLVGVATGPCFGANATLLSCCDVIIATEKASVGMGGGPSVVAAAGLGEHSEQDLGSMDFQVPNGDVDILVPDDRAAVEAAKKYLAYFQGTVDDWDAPDQRQMRHIIPENRVRTYDMRQIVETLADEGSVLEVRRDFGGGVITALIRVAGRPMGLVANNPAHLAGAVDSPGADKGARFLQLCDAFDLPVVVLMDCPGIMVGPDHERTALVRHSVRMFNVGGNLSTAMFGVMVRKAYGLGVQAMCGGSAMVPFFSVAWPTAEFAGMNIEGAVKLSARRELAAIEDPEERKVAYDRRVSQGYESARAINSGARYVIDPADTRAWVERGLKSLPPKPPREGKRRPYVDTW